MKKPTALMSQYMDIKANHQDSILFFRMGDFYEMFFDDAKVASRILQIALTTRDKNSEEPVPMCGFPHFASESYIKKLIDSGHKVAVCEQVEDPSESKGIVKREVVKVVTPGTYEPENPKENSYILSLYPMGKRHGMAVSDVSTGDFVVFESDNSVTDEIGRFDPREILCPLSLQIDIHYTEALKDHFVSFYDDFSFDYTESYRCLLDYFRVGTLNGFGCEGMTAAISAAGGLLAYLMDTQKSMLSFDRIRVLHGSSYMFLDAVAKKNLELIKNIRDDSSDNTLLHIMDETLTPMGGRLLKENILKPLINIEEIHKRLNSTETLYNDFRLLDNIRIHLKNVQDIDRLISRVIRGSANARDLAAISSSIEEITKIREILKMSDDILLGGILLGIKELNDISFLISSAVIDSPPNTIKDGGIIKKGYNSEVDELREISQKGKSILSELESREKEKTGVNSLKVGFNKVFGYYIEITKANLHMVPENYIRKQTLANAERFITEELKEYENKILGAEERLKSIEYHLFKELTEEVMQYSEALRTTSASMALLDFLQSLAFIAKRNNYVKPVISADGVLEISDGRHPVLERSEGNERFIPNDVLLDLEDNKLLIITGPNMAGKSTYMRQVAIITLMAQAGSFVPAGSAKIGITDRIFTRIGASDYLAGGQSTFMVEMIETANILNNATERSLIILDEVGRGTSTFDGISIAWAVAEYIAGELKSRTLFATHYNELTELSITAEGVRNYNVSVKEWGEEIIFLRKIIKGSADKSYGIQVARLAGLPENVINRAKEVLANLEKEELCETGEPKFAGRKKKRAAEQLDLFAGMDNPVISELSRINTSEIRPEEAIAKLNELKRLASKR